LAYADFVDVAYVHEGTSVPLGNVPYVLRTPWASRPGTTDDNGHVRADELPPGGALIEVQEYYLVEKPVPPIAGGGVPAADPVHQVALRLLDRSFQPRAGVPYRILAEFPVAWDGETDSNGLIRQDLPTNITKVSIIYDEGETEVQFAALPGMNDIGGVQRRLTNLGYDAGAPTGTINAQTEAAILKFRRDRGLGDPGNGAALLDATTIRSLEAAHGH
jgi:hypothetical protein